MRVAVLGSGAGALAVAADMSRHGRRTVMADLDGERSELDPVAERGGVLVADGRAPRPGWAGISPPRPRRWPPWASAASTSPG